MKDFDPGQDPIDFAGRHLTSKMSRMYGAELVVGTGPTREIELVRCPYLEDSAKYGIPGLRICEAHEAWWDEQTRGIRTGPRVRITKRMRDGDRTCRVIVSADGAAPEGS